VHYISRLMVGHEEQAVTDEDYSICIKTPTDTAYKCVNDLRYRKKPAKWYICDYLSFLRANKGNLIKDRDYYLDDVNDSKPMWHFSYYYASLFVNVLELFHFHFRKTQGGCWWPCC
jgi:hypothetical protein